MNENFARIERLPTYVFAITNELKAKARSKGEDIIDFGMGNPDQPTPPHIVEKMVEVARRADTHRYSASRGIPRLRRAITSWYKDRYGVTLDPETEANMISEIYSLNKEITIIFVTHRKALLDKCDILLEVHNGKLTQHKK